MVLAALGAVAAYGQTGLTDSLELRGVKTESVTYKGRQAVRVTGDPGVKDGEALAILKGETFKDGAIELWISGEPTAGAGSGARGFVGVAFRVSPQGARYEAFYLRPTNGRADDQVRRNHSAQYISHPDHPWFQLRKDFPEKYESYVDLVPGEWTRVKVEVRGKQARLFVNGAQQPTLIVNDLFLGEEGGGVAFWLGPGTLAHFADLKVTRY
ncbi:hypothetical protein [uncultured Paludibaculum sp.]|uniref:hypothetical protein n=1 Tax=uncultured Paludibaculum sp. TaxID=1765020 RepID=UPI002AAAE111|nr:hypothetical protein [uncultured Paludibaculum sp.]